MRYWWGLGRRASRNVNGRLIASVMMSIGTAVLILAFVGAAAVVATYQGRIARDWARAPVAATDTAHAKVWWDWMTDDADGNYVDVIAIEPANQDDSNGSAPLPPGLDHWPRPGQVVLSPALANTPAGAEIVQRYGTASDETISINGLTDPAERIAYVRPQPGVLNLEQATPVDHFGLREADEGLSSQGQLGSAKRQKPLPLFLAVYFFLVAIPALILATSAARSAADSRDRQIGLLWIGGASKTQRLAFFAGHLFRPWAVGVAAAATLCVPWLIWDIRLPGVRYTLLSQDLRAHVALLGIVFVAGTLASAMIAVVRNRYRPAKQGTRPSAKRVHERAWKMIALPLICWLLVAGYSWTLTWGRNLGVVFLYAALVLVIIAIPPFTGAMTALLAKGSALIARKYGATALLVAARQTLAQPAAIRRLGSAMALVVVLAAHFMVWTTILSAGSHTARQIRAEVGESIATLEVRHPQPWGEDVKAALGPNVEPISVSFPASDSGEGTLRIYGACSAIKALSLPCDAKDISVGEATDPRVAVIAGLFGEQEFTTAPADLFADSLPDDNGESVADFAITLDGGNVPIVEIRSRFAHSSLPASVISPVADSWDISGADNQAKARWLLLFGPTALTILTLALTGVVLGDAVKLGESSGVLRMWGARPRFYRLVSAGRVFLPLVIAIAVGSGTAAWTTIPLRHEPMGGYLPDTYLMTTVIIPLLIAAVMGLVGAHALVKDASRWRPGKDDS